MRKRKKEEKSDRTDECRRAAASGTLINVNSLCLLIHKFIDEFKSAEVNKLYILLVEIESVIPPVNPVLLLPWYIMTSSGYGDG